MNFEMTSLCGKPSEQSGNLILTLHGGSFRLYAKNHWRLHVTHHCGALYRSFSGARFALSLDALNFVADNMVIVYSIAPTLEFTLTPIGEEKCRPLLLPHCHID